jgi:ketosteroid isomerase-like protein
MNPAEIMTSYLAAARAGDWDRAFGHFADDIEFRIPGRSEWAGVRRGRAEARGYIESVRDRFGEDQFELELVDMLAGDERFVLIVRERFLGDGPPIEINRSNVYRVRDGKIAEITIYEGDQYEVDALLH